MHLEPWQSWAIVGLGAAGAYVYYSRTGNKRRGRGRAPFIPSLTKQRRTSPRRGSSADAGSGSSSAIRKNQSRKGANRTDANAAEVSSSSTIPSSNDKLKKRRGGKQESSQLAQSSAVDVPTTTGANDREEDVDNREFAKQMSGLKTGSSLAKKDGPTAQTKRQRKQAELPLNSFNALAPDMNGASSSKDLSNASSTTGADADDDLSPFASPPLDAQQQTATSGDISDMLETPTKGPSVLRLTEVEEPKRQSKPQKIAQESETKKQRQNRRKNEEKKLAREQAEKERRMLLEKQLRTAREAEGRPARNGVAPLAATNVWNKPAAARTTTPQNAPSSGPNGPLLDTFDDSATAVSNGRTNELQDASEADMKAWRNDGPSEEEQMRILSEMEGSGGWNTVSKGGKKKKAAANSKEHERKTSIPGASAVETDGHNTSTSDDIVRKPTPSSQSQTEDETPKPSKTKKEDVDPKIWNRDNIHLHPDYDPSYPYALTGHPEDSDWAVV
ncbi:MAG: hypothetical protein LQ338_007505 [Usnochroma carphineum]|nr:MAG: hypothetical protein LQ338_007505 [Usnochroma carphineum]